MKRIENLNRSQVAHNLLNVGYETIARDNNGIARLEISQCAGGFYLSVRTYVLGMGFGSGHTVETGELTTRMDAVNAGIEYLNISEL